MCGPAAFFCLQQDRPDVAQAAWGTVAIWKTKMNALTIPGEDVDHPSGICFTSDGSQELGLD